MSDWSAKNPYSSTLTDNFILNGNSKVRYIGGFGVFGGPRRGVNPQYSELQDDPPR